MSLFGFRHGEDEGGIGDVLRCQFMRLLRKCFQGMILKHLFGFCVQMCSNMAVQDEEAEKLIEKWKQEEKQNAPQKGKTNKNNQILESAYNSGSSDAWGASSTVEDLIRQGYTKSDINGMQIRQGRINYKEEYGEPKTSEEKQLMEQYAEKYAEGFMKTMFKN